jgi:hypothetical protein
VTTAPVGTEVTIAPYDTDDPVEDGEYLVTTTGRSYLVLDARPAQRGAHAGRRWRLTCLVVDPEHVPADAVTHPLIWYPR